MRLDIMSMDLSNLTEFEKDRLLHLLKERDKDQTENRLDYMRWDLYEEQNDIREYTLDRIRTKEGCNIIVIFGGNRSGKTECGAGIVAQVFKDYSRKRIWCGTLSDISVKVQQRKLYELIRVKDVEYGEYNAVRGWKNKTIISNNKSVIYFKTYEQGSQSFQGDDIDIAWFDEECPYDVFQETMIRLGDREGVMLLTFTSLMGFTRLVNRLWDSNDKNVKSTVLTFLQNPFLSKAVKAQLEASIDPDELASRRDGKPSLREGLIYKNYGRSHRVQRFNYHQLVKSFPNRYELHEGIDPHERTPHHWIMFLYDRSTDVIYCVEEIKAPMESMLIRDFALLIKHRRQGYNPSYCQIDTSAMKPDVINVHPDEDQLNAHTIRMEFMNCGIETMLCAKDNAVGIEAVRGRLKTVKTADGTVKRKPKIFVFDDLEGINWEFTRYAWDSYSSAKTEEKKEMINKPLKKNDHFMDIIKYECIKLKSDYGTDNDDFSETKEMFDRMGY